MLLSCEYMCESAHNAMSWSSWGIEKAVHFLSLQRNTCEFSIYGCFIHMQTVSQSHACVCDSERRKKMCEKKVMKRRNTKRPWSLTQWSTFLPPHSCCRCTRATRDSSWRHRCVNDVNFLIVALVKEEMANNCRKKIVINVNLVPNIRSASTFFDSFQS